MSRDQFYQWYQEIQQRFSELKKWQVLGFTMISYGIIKARHAQASKIAEELPEFGKASTVERRVQRWIANSRIDVQAACIAWTKWVLAVYQGERVYLLVDETKLSDRIGCMMISLGIENRAIPLIWKCYQANSSEAYPEEGQVGLIIKLLTAILAVIPKNKQIVVQADRGIGTSPNLMEKIAENDVFYLFRLQKTSTFIKESGEKVVLGSVIGPGEEWHAPGRLFSTKKVKCHVHVLWEEGQEEPWCLATNMEGLSGKEYAKRVWQEESFRDLKSGGWQWQKNLSRNPDTIERLLLPMVLAYTWCVSLGIVFNRLEPATQLKFDCIRKHRKYSVFRQGLRFFKRMFWVNLELQFFRIGPFYAES